MGLAKPDAYARELGLEFLAEEPKQSNMKVLRFTFKFPDDVKSPQYAEVVARVTQWAKKVKPWTFMQMGPLPIVAAELTWGNRWKVALVNRDNKKRIKAFWHEEAQARRTALSQPHPLMGIRVLDQMAPKPKQKETVALRAALMKAAEVLDKDGPVALDTRALPMTTVDYGQERAKAEAARGPVFAGDGQGTGAIH